MGARMNLFLFISLVVAAMLHGSSAQTTHVVGDALGWLVPPGGDAAYRTWAATRSFAVGDVLVFNFSTNRHTVAEVSEASFESCNTTNPISISTTGPANITLTTAGEHHFICTFSGHCGFGQKLAINVSGSTTAPTPQPAAVTPAPSRVGMTYTVGDNLGWLVPPGGQLAYQTWARGNNFMLGDILVFNFTNGAHSVIQVTRPEFDSCSVSTTTTPPITASPARITLTSGGEHYFFCTFPQHCSLGQRLAINVTGGGSTPAPSPSATPPPSSDVPTPSTRTPTSAPPPPSNAASSSAGAAWPFFFFVFALAFLYN